MDLHEEVRSVLEDARAALLRQMLVTGPGKYDSEGDALYLSM